jgi:hypothetical protein
MALAMLFAVLGSLLTGCGQSQPPAASITVAITAAHGGTITNDRGATLTIPANALSADAHVTLADVGSVPHTSGDPLQYISDGFRVLATPLTGNAAVTFNNPSTLSITGHADSKVRDTIVAEADPTQPGYVTLHDWHQDFNTTNNDGKVTERYAVMASVQWAIAVPSLVQQPTPTEGSVLQVPWYDQNGLPWCVPTSLTEMLRYYDFSENAGDALNATFGPTEALANWQVAARNHQSAGGGAGYNETTAVGITDYWDPNLSDPSTYSTVNSGPHTLHYAWDDRFLLTPPNASPAYQYLKDTDLGVYITLINTGLFGILDRRPIAIMIDRLNHSMVVVGVDGNGLYIDNSNGGIAQYVTWANLNSTNFGLGSDATQHGIESSVVYGEPIKPADEREGSVVLTQNNISFATPNSGTASLQWDGTTAHPHGYYFLDGANPSSANVDLGAQVTPGGTVNYAFQIANVTNIQLTYTVLAEESIGAYGTDLTSQSFTVTVAPYSVSGFLSSSFTAPAFGPTQGILDIKLLGVNNHSIVQDVKYVRYNFGGLPPPVVRILSPATLSHIPVNSPFVLSAYARSGDGAQMLDSAIDWQATDPFGQSHDLGHGNSLKTSLSIAQTYTITASATDQGLTTTSAPITLIVDPKSPPPAQPSVQILSPTAGQEIVFGGVGTSAKVTLSSTASTGVTTYSWTDSLGVINDSNANDILTISQSQIGCAPKNDTITLTVTDSHNQQVSANVSVTFLPNCIN